MSAANARTSHANAAAAKAPKAPAQPPPEICGYRLLRVFPNYKACLADAGNGRKVVLKVLEADCLLKGQLHPSIKERLARVRELAHLQVSNLHGVEREGDTAYL